MQEGGDDGRGKNLEGTRGKCTMERKRISSTDLEKIREKIFLLSFFLQIKNEKLLSPRPPA